MDEIDKKVRDLYIIQERLGKGAYGIVWKAVDKTTNEIVAVKKNFDAFRNEIDAQRTFREIMYLQEFSNHENIIRLQNVIKADNDKDIYLVFDHMDTDLHVAIQGKILQEIHARYIMYQIFKALKFIHSGSVIHRDLKPSNVLLNEECFVKVADFGLARSTMAIHETGSPDPGLDTDPTMTADVATMWYRPPEILLGSKFYGTPADMWACGCILGEMLLGKALFEGSSTFHQIDLILQLVGRPSASDIASMQSPYAAPTLKSTPIRATKSLADRLPKASPDALDLLKRLLVFNPTKRLTVDEALAHPFVGKFFNPKEIPILPSPVKTRLDDNTRRTIRDYRESLYDDIAAKRDQLRKFWSEQAKQKAGVVQSPPKPDPPVVSALTPQPQIAPQQKQQQSQPQQPPQQPLLQHGAKSVMGTSMVGASAAVKDPRSQLLSQSETNLTSAAHKQVSDLEALRALATKPSKAHTIEDWQPTSRAPVAAYDTRQPRTSLSQADKHVAAQSQRNRSTIFPSGNDERARSTPSLIDPPKPATQPARADATKPPTAGATATKGPYQFRKF